MHECPDCGQACDCDGDDLWAENFLGCDCNCSNGWEDEFDGVDFQVDDDEPVISRTLHAHLKDNGDVDVQGFLKFTKVELEDIANAIMRVASRRPADYKPQKVKRG